MWWDTNRVAAACNDNNMAYVGQKQFDNTSMYTLYVYVVYIVQIRRRRRRRRLMVRMEERRTPHDDTKRLTRATR